jgi:uncharacterized damage-inducible protein DinB
MEPDHCYVTVEAFLDHWRGVRGVTQALLASFEERDLASRAFAEGRTVGETFHHIGGHQFFVARGVLLRRWRAEPGEPDIDWNKHREETVRSKAAVGEWLSLAQARLEEWVAVADPGALTDLRPDNPWHEGMRGWLLLHHAYQDELHHRGQLFTAARLLGRRPPLVFAEEDAAYWNPRKGR